MAEENEDRFGLKQFGTDFSLALEDPDFLSYLGGVGSAISQGKGAGEALDPSGFIAKKQASAKERASRIAAGKALQTPVASALAPVEPLKPRSAADIFTPTAADKKGVNKVTISDGKMVIDANTRDAIADAAAGGIAPAARALDVPGRGVVAPDTVGAALAPEAEVALPARAPAPTPQRQPSGFAYTAESLQPSEDFLQDLSVEQQLAILGGQQAGKAATEARIGKEFEAGKIVEDVTKFGTKDVRTTRGAQGDVITREERALPVKATGVGSGVKGDMYIDPVTRQREFVVKGGTPANENAVLETSMMTQDQQGQSLIRFAQLGQTLIDNKDEKGEDLDMSVTARLPLIREYNNNPVGDSVILINPPEDVVKSWWKPITWLGGETDPEVYLADKDEETLKHADNNLRALAGGFDPDQPFGGEITTPIRSTEANEVKAKQLPAGATPAPQAALDFLKTNPDAKIAFRTKYGYLPGE